MLTLCSLYKFDTPGEHPFLVEGSAGSIEGVLSVPNSQNSSRFALLGHPHSLHGGTMNNKVVTTMARAFNSLGIACIRFNFRGVGQSAGVFDSGIGESEDMLLLAKRYQLEFGEGSIFFAGFSFGSFVAYRAAAQFPNAPLISIAPPVQNFNYAEFSTPPRPWTIIQGEEDEVVSPAAVFDFVETQNAAIEIIRFSNVGHFFHGRLIDLRTCLIKMIRQTVADRG